MSDPLNDRAPTLAPAEAATSRFQRFKDFFKSISNVKDLATIVSSLIAALALCFTGYQFYRGRQALQSQTVLTATNNAFQLDSDMLKNPKLYGPILGQEDEQQFSRNVAVRQIIAFYVARYVEHESHIWPDEMWAPIVTEICALKANPQVAPTLSFAIQKKQYPDGFIELLNSCK